MAFLSPIQETAVRNRMRHMLIELVSGSGYTWDKGTARYRSRETGRFVSEGRILEVVENYGETAVRPALASITDSLISGSISLSEWQRLSLEEIKGGIVISSMGGRGGKDQMTASDWGRTGGRVRFQAQKLDGFAREIKAGGLSEAQIRDRILRYAGSSRIAYFDGLSSAKAEAGYVDEQRFLQPGESCADCIGYHNQGRVPIGTLPEPGVACECMSNCNCVKVYYRAED